MKIKGISPIADHWRTKAEELERQCARKEALLREIQKDCSIKLFYEIQSLIGEQKKQSLNPKNEEGKAQALNERKET